MAIILFGEPYEAVVKKRLQKYQNNVLGSWGTLGDNLQGSFRLSLLNRKSYGRVQCGFKKAEISRCGSVRFSDIANPTVRFGAVVYPTVRFRAVLKNRKCYGEVRCG